MLRFGAYSSGVVIINVFYNFSPQFFLARMLDLRPPVSTAAPVTITQTFDRLVVQVLNPVIMPAILAEKRSGESLKRIYLDAVELLSAVQWPFLLVFAIMTQPIILIWLGPAWLEVVPLVRILCIAYLALFAACLTYPVLVAGGQRARRTGIVPDLAAAVARYHVRGLLRRGRSRRRRRPAACRSRRRSPSTSLAGICQFARSSFSRPCARASS